MKRNIQGVEYYIASPSIYHMIGLPVCLMYGSRALMGDANGWYFCHNGGGAPLNRRPFETCEEASRFISHFVV